MATLRGKAKRSLHNLPPSYAHTRVQTLWIAPGRAVPVSCHAWGVAGPYNQQRGRKAHSTKHWKGIYRHLRSSNTSLVFARGVATDPAQHQPRLVEQRFVHGGEGNLWRGSDPGLEETTCSKLPSHVAERWQSHDAGQGAGKRTCMGPGRNLGKCCRSTRRNGTSLAMARAGWVW